MDQSLVIAILVGLIVFLFGLLLLLIAASAVLLWNNRRLERERRAARRKALARARPQRPPDMPSPTPISRVAAPLPRWNIEVSAADEAATEVIGSHHAAAFYGYDEDTGTTEVRTSPLEGVLRLDESEETTKVGRAPARGIAKKK